MELASPSCNRDFFSFTGISTRPQLRDTSSIPPMHGDFSLNIHSHYSAIPNTSYVIYLYLGASTLVIIMKYPRSSKPWVFVYIWHFFQTQDHPGHSGWWWPSRLVKPHAWGRGLWGEFRWRQVLRFQHSIMSMYTGIAKFTGPAWGQPGSCRPQMGPIVAPWTLLSGQRSCWAAGLVDVAIIPTRSNDPKIIVRRAGLLWSQQDFEWRWSVPLFKCLTVLEFSFILFDLCLLITFFNFIMNYVPIVTFWIFTYHKIWILSIMFCFIWSHWIIYFLACLEVSWRVVS